MNDQLYKKRGRRYTPIGFSDGWFGFPSDGVWIVQTTPTSKSSECILKIGELQDLQPAANLILGYKDKIVEYLEKEVSKGNLAIMNKSRNEFVLDMLKEITKR